MADIDTLVDFFRGSPPRRTPEDDEWKEVDQINSYAVLMGYLSMAVRGTGLLVFTWTTVVLLGGFVSSLQKKDFWCLTAITFMQAAGVFDASGKKSLSKIDDLFNGLVATPKALPTEDDRGDRTLCGQLWYALAGLAMAGGLLIEVLVVSIIVCPLFVLYVSGPYVPIWLGVWRLSHRDYSKGNGDASGENLTVALDVLYALIVAQGVLVYMMGFHALARWLIVADVVKKLNFDKFASWSVWDYMDATRKGCSKDPSFEEGRNMITNAVDRIKSDSVDRKLSGARILDTLIKNLRMKHWGDKSFLRHQRWDDELAGRHMLLKQLIVDSEDIVLTLLQMLDWRGPCDKEMRKRAARIVAYIAGGIHLKQYPQGIQWIASLLGTFQEYNDLEPYQRDWLLHVAEQDWTQQSCLAYLEYPEGGYKVLVVQALRILWRLAANEDNSIIIMNHVGLLSKAMAPVTNDLIHNHSVGDHDEWSRDVIEGSLRLMCQLVTAPGETGKKLRSDISANNEAIRTMERILQCNDCSARLKDKAIQTLTELYMETPSRMENFMKTLLDTYRKEPERREETERDKEFKKKFDKYYKKPKKGADCRATVSLRKIFKAETEDPDIIETAARALMRISLQMENSATIILMQNADIINDLTTLLLRAKEKSHRRVAAAVILERLCIYYNDINNLKKNNLTEALFLQCQDNLKKFMTDEMPKVLEEIHSYLDLDELHDLDQNSMFMTRFIPAYLSLLVTVCEKRISTYQDSARLFGATAITVPMLLKKMEKRSTPYSLRILKLITKIVIAVMNQEGSYFRDLDSLMQSLSTASRGMSTIDASMVFAGTEDGAWRVRDSMLNRGEEQPFRSLRSLVKQAQKLVDEKKDASNKV